MKKVENLDLFEEGVETSSSAISLFLCRYRKIGRLTDAPRSGHQLRQGHLDFINQQ